MSKNIIGALVALIISSPAGAQSLNTIYIDQVGSGSIIDVTQTGANNSIGTSTSNAIRLTGNNQLVTIAQIGSSNTGFFGVQGPNVILSSTVVGNLNNVSLTCGTDPTGNNNNCADSTITANVTGSNNTANVIVGSKSTSTINIVGDTNTAAINSNTSNLFGSKAAIQAIGNSNNVTIAQNGPAGLNGFDAAVSVDGSSNTIGITQTGTVDSTVHVNSQGSNNNITVRSGN